MLRRQKHVLSQSTTPFACALSVSVIRINFKNLLMPLFLTGCFPVDFQEVKRPLRTKSVKRPIKVGKRPINEGKRPVKAKVLVGASVGCLPPEKKGKNGRTIGRWLFLGQIFPFFGHFFSFFSSGGAKLHFSAPFFPITGRKPDLGSIQGNRDRKSCKQVGFEIASALGISATEVAVYPKCGREPIELGFGLHHARHVERGTARGAPGGGREKNREI